jgi:hypothetical protein
MGRPHTRIARHASAAVKPAGGETAGCAELKDVHQHDVADGAGVTGEDAYPVKRRPRRV